MSSTSARCGTRCTRAALPLGPARIATGAPVIASSASAGATRATETASPRQRRAIILQIPSFKATHSLKPASSRERGTALWRKYACPTEDRRSDLRRAPSRPARSKGRFDTEIIVRGHHAKRQGAVRHDERRLIAYEHDHVPLL